ncbi:hypothetical protein ACPPVU_08940 [Mucilaginibacter sp. McL0603]|uniref:hypothetical protein n=1 Tax=Mucilaginibacter sp. McL0603 TaxID=3415670 RepID=UPI003CED668A
MKNVFPSKIGLLAFLLICVSTFITSCKKETLVDSNQSPKIAPPKPLDTVYYQWGDLSISRSNITDIIQYDNTGKISKITSIYSVGQLARVVNFTYQDNKITLDTDMKDIYTLDESGRVVSHQSTEVQNGLTFTETQTYNYDSNGYLSTIPMSVNGTVYSTINYKVANGNYTSYVLSNTSDGKITREYDFTYGNTKATSPISLFTPVFGDNTYVAVEKYLNFGKQSVNTISGINYTIANENGTVSKGTLPATSQVDTDGNLTGLDLSSGTYINAFPSDNLSPLPRSVRFVYK